MQQKNWRFVMTKSNFLENPLFALYKWNALCISARTTSVAFVLFLYS